MKKTLIILIAILATSTMLTAEDIHPKANEKATVSVGKARFTILTDRLIRMEWAEDGAMEDNATLGIVNRETPVPVFKVTNKGKGCTIKTDKVTLNYKGNGKFTAENLSVSFKLNGKKVIWHPGDSDKGNLNGTTRTLDGYKGKKTRDPFDKGVCSRDGWAIIDESTRHLLVPSGDDWEYWVKARTDVDRQDWYIFAYGHDYKAAVKDFTVVAGKIPLPPKYAFGYWWCKYWIYSDTELKDLAQHLKDFSIPTDVMIIDMDWHKLWGYNSKLKQKDEAGERLGWTGYTWDESLFPCPENLLKDLHDYGLKTSLNLHPASGLVPREEPYERFRKDYLSRTNDYDGPKDYIKPDGTNAYIPFRIDQQAWANAYFNSVLGPIEKQGVDFWWLDWQQYRESRYTKNLSNTFWLNYTFWNDKARQSAALGKKADRPMIYHRWGGIGSHRYQLGFSGDTYATWTVLGRIPWFTATASNVGYGYWGHDIGGHMQPKGVDRVDPELYTRWLQSAVFTPIFKTHSTKSLAMENRFWVFPQHFDMMRKAIRLRYELSPYIYTGAREAYDNGICICRPLYYYFPEEEKAYTEDEEFLFGNDILATVVCTPLNNKTGLAGRKMWFPGQNGWFDIATGTMYRNCSDSLQYTIQENPWFVREGAVIPLAGKNIPNLQTPSNELRLRIIPGMGEFRTSVYEDDGKSQAYDTDFARTDIQKQTSEGMVKVQVNARSGKFEGALATRKITLELAGAAAPSKVTVNGADIPYSRFARTDGKAYWTYDGYELCVKIFAEESPAEQELDFEISTDFKFFNGEKGLLNRMSHLSEEVKLAYATYVSISTIPHIFFKFSQAGSIITENPFKAEEITKALSVEELKAEFESYPSVPKEFADKVVGMTEILRR